MATLIFNDRINTFNQMKAIDAVIDSAPSATLVKELARLRIQNLDAFRELHALNTTGEFRYIHPLIKHQSLRAELEKMLNTNPGEYLDSYQRAKENVKRYSSFIKNKKRTPEQRKKDKTSLAEWTEKCDLYKSILEKNRT
jgi:hypothetical protein